MCGLEVAQQFNLFSRSSFYYLAFFTPSQFVNRGCITRKIKEKNKEAELKK